MSCPECGAVVVEPDEPPETEARITHQLGLVRRLFQESDPEKGYFSQWVEKGIKCPNEIQDPNNPERKRPCRAFISFGREGGACFAVTRHDFEGKGVTCPKCGEQAAEPGEWSLVQSAEQIERDEEDIETDRWTEEGVCCWHCNSYLMASPDSDVDHLDTDEPYDRDIFHKFVRPEGWTPPTQDTEDRPIEEGDRVVINRGLMTEIKGQKQDVGGCEGQVVSLVDGKATIKMGRSPVVEGSQDTSITIDAEHCRVIRFDTIHPNDHVRVTRGKYRGQTGIVLEGKMARITVRLGDGTITTLPIERLTRKAPQEQS